MYIATILDIEAPKPQKNKKTKQKKKTKKKTVKL